MTRTALSFYLIVGLAAPAASGLAQSVPGTAPLAITHVTIRDITNTGKIRAVVLGGRHVDRTALDLLLREAEKTASAKQR